MLTWLPVCVEIVYLSMCKSLDMIEAHFLYTFIPLLRIVLTRFATVGIKEGLEGNIPIAYKVIPTETTKIDDDEEILGLKSNAVISEEFVAVDV